MMGAPFLRCTSTMISLGCTPLSISSLVFFAIHFGFSLGIDELYDLHLALALRIDRLQLRA